MVAPYATKECEHCGREFVRTDTSNARWLSRKYCSADCNYAAKRQSAEGRFWEYVDQLTESGCWEWTGTKHEFGYGLLSVKRRCVLAHRFSWELHRGPIPAGLFVCHTCDNPPCTNPDHLFLGTQTDNMRDASIKGRIRGPSAPQTVCVNGHSVAEHGRRMPNGRFRCRGCEKIYWRRYAEKKAKQGVSR